MVTETLAQKKEWSEVVEHILSKNSQSDNHKFKKWLKDKEYLNDYFFDPRLYYRAYIIQHKINQNDTDHFTVITGKEGCITGDTVINVNRCSLGRKYRIDYMFRQYHQRTENSKSKLWDLKHPTKIRSYDGKSIRLHEIEDVIYSGEKEVYKLKLENGLFIKATFDHEIMTSNGFKKLNDLNLSDDIMCDTLKPQRGKQRSFKLKDISINVIYHPFKNIRNEVEVHRLIYEANLNNLSFMDYLDIIWNDTELSKTLTFINPNNHHIHHKDGNHYNNNIDNLELLNNSDHHLLHSKQDDGFRNFNQGIPIYSKVNKIEKLGIEKTYDIKCKEPYHNFVANGIVIHNCGKSTLAIQLASLVDPSFCLSRICFTMKEYIEGIENAQKGQAFILDEGNMFLFNRESYSEDSKFMVKLFAIMRQKNLFTLICVPNYFTLDAYVREHRVDTLIYGHTRGKYLAFISKGLKAVSREGKKTHNISTYKVPSGFWWEGYWNKDFPVLNDINEEKYKEYKTNHLKQFILDVKKMLNIRNTGTLFISLKEAQKIIPVSQEMLIKSLKKGNIEGKKLGKRWFINRESLLKCQNIEEIPKETAV